MFGGAKIPWHPATRLVIALHHDRRSASPRADSAERLLKLTLHPLDSVSELAFDALFADKDEHLRWVAGQLAVNLCIVHRGEFKEGGWDQAPNQKARADSLAAALSALKKSENGPMPKLPPAWVKGSARGRRKVPDDQWQLPEVFFDAQKASKLLTKMPLEAWMAVGYLPPTGSAVATRSRQLDDREPHAVMAKRRSVLTANAQTCSSGIGALEICWPKSRLSFRSTWRVTSLSSRS